MQWTAFRPTAVYGPGDKEIKPIFNATRYGFLPVVGKSTNYFSLLHIDDFVAAIQCWLEINTTTNGIFELDDGKPGGYSYQSLAAIAQEVWQRPVRCFSIPITLVRLVANTNLWLSRLLHYAPMLTPGKARELQHPNWLCDNKPLMHALPSWHPSVNLRDALPQIIWKISSAMIKLKLNLCLKVTITKFCNCFVIVLGNISNTDVANHARFEPYRSIIH